MTSSVNMVACDLTTSVDDDKNMQKVLATKTLPSSNLVFTRYVLISMLTNDD